MFEDVIQGGPVSSDMAHEILSELERNTPEEIRQQRAHFRVDVKATVVMQPANASQLMDFKVQGVTGDVSEGGFRALFPIPVTVGDVYRFTFDRSQLDLPLMFARCLRCRLVQEEAYEGGFVFFSPITLPNQNSANDLTGL